MTRLLRLLLIGLLSAGAFGSVCAQGAETVGESKVPTPNVAKLKTQARAAEAKLAALQARAKKEGVALEITTAEGGVAVLVDFDQRGMPRYMSTETNRNAAGTTATSGLQTGGVQGYNLNGQGQRVAIWDGGGTFVTRVSHVEFGGRATVRDGSTTVDDHGTHVAGTMIASGVDPRVRGMAPEAQMDAYSFGNDEPEMANAAAGFLPNGTTPLPAPVTVSNHSYGFRAGWNSDINFGAGSTPPWYFLGDTTLSGTEDAYYGRYDQSAIDYDQIAYDAPNYLIFKSSGNPRATGPGTTPTLHWVFCGTGCAGNVGGWVRSSTVRGAGRNGTGNQGYDCLTGNANSKNIMTVGAAAALPNGFGTGTVAIASFSAAGPTDDGRIKPDIIGNGVSVFSSFSGSNNAYGTFSGTSMSSPNVSGSSSLVQQMYRQKFNAFPRSSTLKGIILHTADDVVTMTQSGGGGWGNPAGTFPGPDYLTGWGMMNTTRAVGVIASDNLTSFVKELSLAQGQTYTFPVSVTGNQPLKVTICWTDPVGALQAASLNDRTPRLVNDLDLRLLDAAGNVVATLPWTLNPNSPATAAVQNADNFRDNIEQIFINAPAVGNYTIRVTHKGTLSGGPQAFALVASGVVAPVVGGVANAPAVSIAGSTSACPSSTLTATSATATSYQWFLNDAPIPGATGSVYIATVAGVYRVAVRNSSGVTISTATPVTSSAATVAIATNPTTAPTALGATPVTIQLTTVLTGTPSYQWLRDGQPITGATSTSYSVTAAGEYSLRVSFTAGCEALSGSIRFTQAGASSTTLGDAASQLTGLRNRTHQVAVSNELNTIAYVHRGWGSPTGTMGAFGNAQIFYDVSTNGGSAWTNNQGPLNVRNGGYSTTATANPMAQHPQAAIYNPSGNTDPNNAFLVWTASYGDSATASAGALSNSARRLIVGSMRLNGTGRREAVLPTQSVSTVGSGGLVQRVRGEFWFADIGNANPGRVVRLFKGVFNPTTDSVEWSLNRVIQPPYLGNPTNPVVNDYSLAFSPDGNTGWLLVQTDIVTTGLTPSVAQPLRALYPVLYKTTDGGATWTADANPYFVNLNTLSPLTAATGTTTNVSMAFESDFAVDNAGRPHIVSMFLPGSNTYSIFNGPGAHAAITSNDGGTTWTAQVLAPYIGVFRGTVPTSSYTQDLRHQVATNAAGDRVVFAWAESDPAVTGTTFTSNNSRPELKARLLDPSTGTLGPLKTVGTGAGNYVVHHTLPNTALTTGAGSFKLPVVYMNTNTNMTLPHNLSGGQMNARLLDGVTFSDCDLTATPNGFALTASATLICAGSPVTLTAPAGATSYAWTRNGATTPGTAATLNVTTEGVYQCTATYGTCTVTSAIAQVTAPAAPNLTVTQSNPSGNSCSGDVLLTLSNQVSGATYTWRRGTTVVGGNTPSLAVSESGSYTIEVLLAGCSFVSTPNVISIGSVSNTNSVAASAASFCADDAASVTIGSSSAAATYQLVNGGTAIGSAVAGTGSNLVLSVPANTLSAGSTTLAVLVSPNATPACSTLLSNLAVVTVNAKPLITRPGGANTDLVSSVATGNQWYNADTDQPIAGATGATFSPPSGGSYYVIAAGCRSTTFSISTSVEANSVLARSLSVFPTLTRDEVFVKGSLPELRRVTVSLSAADGSQQILGDFTPDAPQIDKRYDVSGLAAGSYVLSVRWGNESATWRVIKQ